MHFVWATKERLPFITDVVERPLHRFISAKATRLGGRVLAVGGMEDHVHLAVLFPGTLSYGAFIGQVKGASSRFVTQKVLSEDEFFDWQEGYGAFGFSPSDKFKVVAYINNQKQHHGQNALWRALETIQIQEST